MLGLTNKKTKTIKKNEYQPTEEEIKLSADIWNKFREAKQNKEPYVELWKKCIDAYNSDYFTDTSKPEYKSDEISNFIFSTIETIKPIMFDNDPQIHAIPKTSEGLYGINKMQSLFDFEWQRDDMSRKTLQAVTLALQIGTAIYGVLWNANDNNGLGNIKNVLINPFNFFPDPMATSIEDAEYIIYATYKHANILKSQYPDKANLLDGGTINEQELVPFGYDTTSVDNQILVLECWQRDYTTQDFEEEIDGTTQKVRKKKYPRGRVITLCPEHNLILSDKENPYKDGSFPFVLLKCYDIPFKFWGKSEIEQLLSPQQYINDLTNQIIDNVKMTTNMPWILDKNCGIPKGQLSNQPGLVVRKNPGTYVDRLQPPNMPAYPRETIEVLKQDIETISGIHDVTQGRKPGSISAASAIMALQEAAQARIRLKVRLLEITLGKLGRMWYDRIKQFWIVERTIRNKSLNEQKDVSVDQLFYTIGQDDLEIDYDFVVVGGSTMPSNKNAMLDILIRLAQTPAEDGLPMIDRATLLSYTNIPNIQQIQEKFAELVNGNKQEAEAQMQQEQQMQMEMQAQAEQSKADAQMQIQMQGQPMPMPQDGIGVGQGVAPNTQLGDEDIAQILALIQEHPQEFEQLLTQLGEQSQ